MVEVVEPASCINSPEEEDPVIVTDALMLIVEKSTAKVVLKLPWYEYVAAARSALPD